MSRSRRSPDDAVSGSDPERIVARWAVECRAAMEAVALLLTGDPDVAEDMAQEAAIEALRVARKDPERVLNVRRPCGWMCVVVLRRTQRWLEKEARRARLLEENEFLVRELLYAKDDASRMVELLVEQVLDMAPDVLTPKQRKVLTLWLAGRSDAQIAGDAEHGKGHRAGAPGGRDPAAPGRGAEFRGGGD